MISSLPILLEVCQQILKLLLRRVVELVIAVGGTKLRFKKPDVNWLVSRGKASCSLFDLQLSEALESILQLCFDFMKLLFHTWSPARSEQG